MQAFGHRAVCQSDMYRHMHALHPTIPCMQQEHRIARSTLRELNRLFTSVVTYKRGRRSLAKAPSPRTNQGPATFQPTLAPIQEEKVEEPQAQSPVPQVSKLEQKKSPKWVVQRDGIRAVSAAPTQSTSAQSQETFDRAKSQLNRKKTIKFAGDTSEAVAHRETSDGESTDDSDRTICEPDAILTKHQPTPYDPLQKREKDLQAKLEKLREKQKAEAKFMDKQVDHYYMMERTDAVFQRERAGLDYTLQFAVDSDGGFYMSTDEPRVVPLPDVVPRLRTFERYCEYDATRGPSDFTRGFSGNDVLARKFGHLEI
ncbi:hypothetical protein GGR57DRAFT_499431 [Xylariaceae sp. FL1272]|nr:hypothetical protein GGR57DRAFT_499431 [Xylariaceae sp. FL1272]